MRAALEVGKVKVKARGLPMDSLDLKFADLQPVVNEQSNG